MVTHIQFFPMYIYIFVACGWKRWRPQIILATLAVCSEVNALVVHEVSDFSNNRFFLDIKYYSANCADSTSQYLDCK